jgi:hypothetical protein
LVLIFLVLSALALAMITPNHVELEIDLVTDPE